MAVMTMERVEIEQHSEDQVPRDERRVWCECAQDFAYTVDGFCECCGAMGHACA